MNNYKIRVKNETESKEAQELFLEYGATGNICLDKSIRYVCTFKGVLTQYDFLPSVEFKQITLPELRELVVLKREGKGGVVIKEYLEPMPNGDYRYHKDDGFSIGGDWILVPEGAEVAVGSSGVIYFWKSHFYQGGIHKDWIDMEEGYDVNWYLRSVPDAKILWQRHAQPVIDDEPFLTPESVAFETMTGHQLDATAAFMGFRSRSSGETDESYREYLRGFGKIESLNDQYAEIEKVRQATTETEYLMQGKNGEKLMESLAQFKNTDHGAEFDNFELLPRTATEIADAALTHIRERASTYDQPEGERSAAKTAQAFNAITGHNIGESEVWLMLQILKDVRQWSRESYHQDSAEDCIAYSALKAESLERNR